MFIVLYYICDASRRIEAKCLVWFGMFGFFTSSSTTLGYIADGSQDCCPTIYVLPYTRQSVETMTSVSAGHIILTPTQPVGQKVSMAILSNEVFPQKVEFLGSAILRQSNFHMSAKPILLTSGRSQMNAASMQLFMISINQITQVDLLPQAVVMHQKCLPKPLDSLSIDPTSISLCVWIMSVTIGSVLCRSSEVP